MVLSDKDIKKAIERRSITVNPLFPDSIQPSTIDVHLGKNFLVYIRDKTTHIDPIDPIDDIMREVEIGPYPDYFTLGVGEFALGILEEEVGVDNTLVGKLDGKSSVGRFGTFVHVTASTLNPGNTLCMTLELYNANHIPIKLYWGMPIAQIAFEQLSSPSENAYGSEKLKNNNYGSSKKPQPSQYFKNFLSGKNDWMEFVKNL